MKKLILLVVLCYNVTSALPNWTSWVSQTINGNILRMRAKEYIIQNQNAPFEFEVYIPANIANAGATVTIRL